MCRIICCCWSPVFYKVPFYFLCQQDFAPVQSARTTDKEFSDHGIYVLDWPADWPELKSTHNLRSPVKRNSSGSGINNTEVCH